MSFSTSSLVLNQKHSYRDWETEQPIGEKLEDKISATENEEKPPQTEA